jgi:DMSO/TMAO reductase YedYZ molybdopterin-dependent catalytic subunit
MNKETETTSVSRRGFVSGVTTAALLPFLSGADKSAWAQTPAAERIARGVSVQGETSLIVRQREPENLEFVFSKLDSFLTPNDRFYVRTHFATPMLDAAKWQLRVEGAVQNPLTLSYDELLKMPSRKIPATLECAGNGRVYLTPPARGVQWEQGAVSTAEWTGVPLSALLARAGLNADALEIVLEGADSGEIKDPPHPAGAIRFARSLPLTKAQNQDVLIAYRMNDVPLPVSHGFPVRAIVPGWYGVASVKWLTRILVLSQPFQGHFQTIDYAYWQKVSGLPTRVPITEMLVKASIARPTFREILPAGSMYRVSGAAWAGETAISKVEISADGGKSWNLARLQNQPVPYSWRLWEYDWRVPASPGRYALMARATDARGSTQPMQRDPDRENYLVNHVVPVEVDVR